MGAERGERRHGTRSLSKNRDNRELSGLYVVCLLAERRECDLDKLSSTCWRDAAGRGEGRVLDQGEERSTK